MSWELAFLAGPSPEWMGTSESPESHVLPSAWCPVRAGKREPTAIVQEGPITLSFLAFKKTCHVLSKMYTKYTKNIKMQ